MALTGAPFAKVPHAVLHEERDVLVPPPVVAGVRVRFSHVDDGIHGVSVRVPAVPTIRRTQPVYQSLGGGSHPHSVFVDEPVEHVRRPAR